METNWKTEHWHRPRTIPHELPQSSIQDGSPILPFFGQHPAKLILATVSQAGLSRTSVPATFPKENFVMPLQYS